MEGADGVLTARPEERWEEERDEGVEPSLLLLLLLTLEGVPGGVRSKSMKGIRGLRGRGFTMRVDLPFSR